MAEAEDEDRGHRFENMALAVLAAIVAVIVAYAILTRPSDDDAKHAEFANVMPNNYAPVLSALIRATGQECDKVCAASVSEPILGLRHVKASCAIAARKITCAHAREFAIKIAPAPAPSR
jgi:hypothetical protein